MYRKMQENMESTGMKTYVVMKEESSYDFACKESKD